MRRSLLLFPLLVVLGTSCGSDAAPAGGGLVGRATFHTSDGVVRTAFLEVADSPDERAQGLMGRDSLGRDSGMLFVFDGPTDGSFWMKDTRIPLSVAFISGDGRVVDVLDMEPCVKDPCPLYTPRAPYTDALEMNVRWFGDHGISIGDTVDLAIDTE